MIFALTFETACNCFTFIIIRNCDPSRSNVELQTQETYPKHENPQPLSKDSNEMNVDGNYYEDVSDQSCHYKSLMIQKQEFEDNSMYTLPYHHVRQT